MWQKEWASSGSAIRACAACILPHCTSVFAGYLSATVPHSNDLLLLGSPASLQITAPKKHQRSSHILPHLIAAYFSAVCIVSLGLSRVISRKPLAILATPANPAPIASASAGP
ncbi:hypothetical protein SBC2_00130 [Caballeronia sp. SBC2]|nr:hypothetical protein SBC2_00130 [Caballeronia sp. SBC2]